MSGPWLSERNESAPIVPTQRVPAHEVIHVCTSYRSGFMHRNGNAYGNIRVPVHAYGCCGPYGAADRGGKDATSNVRQTASRTTVLQQKLLQQRRDDRETERAYLRDPGCAKDERRRQ